ncbi:MAG: hypothetical protein ACRDP2_01565 [Nocardioidaceae bacterium]
MPATRPNQPTRLPSQSRGSKRGGEVVRGLVGLLATLIVVVGLPAGLVLLVGNPLPEEAPNGDWLTAEISTDTLLAVLAIVLWLAWLHFVICLFVELVSDRRGRGLAPHVPGGGVGTQALARRLVSAVLLLAGTSAATLPAATASSDRAPDPAPGAAGTASATVAAQQAGDRVPQAVDRNAEGVVKYYEVQPPSGRHYDTLWDIAERILGSGLRYKEIFELNHGVLQPDGRKLTNADLIQPGWLLQLPGDAEGAGLKVVDHRVSPQSAPTPGVDDTEQSAESEASATPDSERAEAEASRDGDLRDEPGGEEPSDNAESGATSESETRLEADEFDPVVVGEDDRTESEAAETETEAPEDEASESAADENVWAPTFGVAGGLLAAGSALAITAGARRRGR